MSGHSHWSSIKHKKAAVDAKRGKIFSKLARLIVIAVKHGGPDPEMNLRLRYAIDDARRANMPVDNINRAIKRAAGDDGGSQLEEILYEGYGPGGVAILVNCLTDNRNRTAPDLRKIFESHGGNLGQSGSVSFMFKMVGYFEIPKADMDEDTITMLALDAGAEDVQGSKDYWEVYCTPQDFDTVRKSFEDAEVKFETAEITRIASNEVTVEADGARRIMKLLSALDDHDDVQNVYNNMNLSDEVLAEIEQDD